ncbi:Protein png1 [Lithohypha guttulata]|uniref:Protein png1 n=1 Tax=Lithohypha guttulata TaxID=1690604 RepID=A0AAN7TC29_9EURO|nr:Protein png1 [Lithohypha guttulata]KAK5104666.1 Protein png1 [Lithohypha guttulata]
MAGTGQVQPTSLDEQFDFSAGDLSKQFEQLLLTRRLNDLEERARGPRSSQSSNRSAAPSPFRQTQSSSPAPQRHQQQQRQQQPPTPPAYSSCRNTPLVPCAPQDAASLKFRNLLLTLSVTPTKYENPGLLDEALTHIPIDRIYSEAEEEHNIMKGMAASIGENVKEEWGYQDCVIRSLLRWFKREFFEFVCNPACQVCRSPTVAQGQVPPTQEENAYGATRVELYKCPNPACGAHERFPRYSDVWILMKTRRGRAGEFANCFGMLCRAAGARVRWVWNTEDSVWIEVYSLHKRRWIHVDPCEELWDTPRVYTEGWNRKFAYCIAFSNEGATDVTRRYVRNPSAHGLPRNRCPEECLLWMMYEIRKLRRDGMNKPDQQRLRAEDEREEHELQAYVAHAVTRDMLNSIPGSRRQHSRPGEQKVVNEAQQQAQWQNTPFIPHQQDGRNAR